MKKQDIVDAFHKALKQNPGLPIHQVMEIACNSPAPRFYVSYHKAARLISMLERGLPLPINNANRLAMYKELHRRLIKSRGNNPKSYHLLREIINTPAPSFYMDTFTFEQTVYKTIRDKHKNICRYSKNLQEL